MQVLSRKQFMARKTSDTLAVMGCGYSINTITEDQWQTIDSDYNSIATNWFCNAMRPVTFYLVREQCVSPKKLEPGSMPEDLYGMLNAIKTTLIVKKKTGKADNYSHVDNLHRLENPGIIVNELPGKCGADVFLEDIFASGVYHGKCTMWDVLHFAVFMGYKRIVFFGVDLYDFRYFWLPYNDTRPIVAAEGKTCDTPHNQGEQTLRIIQGVKQRFPDIRLMVHNPKSLLAGILPVWSGQ